MARRKEVRVTRTRVDPETGAMIRETVVDDGRPEPAEAPAPIPMGGPSSGVPARRTPHPGWKPGVRDATAAEWVLEQRTAGRSLRDIGREIGRDAMWVSRAAERAVADQRSPSADVDLARSLDVEVELARLDNAQEALDRIVRWSPEASPGVMPPGHREVIAAARTQVSVSDARVRLLGLARPEVVEHRHQVAGTVAVDVRIQVEHAARVLASLPAEAFAAAVLLDEALRARSPARVPGEQ